MNEKADLGEYGNSYATLLEVIEAKVKCEEAVASRHVMCRQGTG
jgi:hypothetical protein